MNVHEEFMSECIELAEYGLGKVAPNPMVGCVIVHDGKIIGKGHHESYGGPHAEVNAINAVKDKSLLKRSTLYVSLEPCAHHGKTPPCTDLIIEHKIPYVVIGSVDSNPIVKGKGIEKLVKAGVDVKTGVLESGCRELNKRFFTFHEKKRPYVILKWAQTINGFTDIKRVYGDGQLPLRISDETSQRLSHYWRGHEQAILAGTATALLDNPRLTVRHASGKNPLRILIDKDLRVPSHFNLLDGSTPTLVLSQRSRINTANVEYITADFSEPSSPIRTLLKTLYERNIQSLLVEGGTVTHEHFIKAGLWDEARIFVSDLKIADGIKAPLLKQSESIDFELEKDKLLIFFAADNKKKLI